MMNMGRELITIYQLYGLFSVSNSNDNGGENYETKALSLHFENSKTGSLM
jgi:hypothetical protein